MKIEVIHAPFEKLRLIAMLVKWQYLAPLCQEIFFITFSKARWPILRWREQGLRRSEVNGKLATVFLQKTFCAHNSNDHYHITLQSHQTSARNKQTGTADDFNKILQQKCDVVDYKKERLWQMIITVHKL